MFMLFTGDTFYPGGGWNDFRGFFISEDDAKRVAKQQDNTWYQVVGSTHLGTEIISEGNIEDL